MANWSKRVVSADLRVKLAHLISTRSDLVMYLPTYQLKSQESQRDRPRWAAKCQDTRREAAELEMEGCRGPGALTLRLGEDGDAERPDVEEAEPDGGEAEGADEHEPPAQRRHALLLVPVRRHGAAPRGNTSPMHHRWRGVEWSGGRAAKRRRRAVGVVETLSVR